MVPFEGSQISGTDTDDEFPTARALKRQKLDHELGRDDTRQRENVTPRKLSPEDYTVGWVCALPIEMAAARAMLDSVHELLPSTRHDTNTYTLGNIGMHNIAIACLALGLYGSNNAATVASNMRRTFPSMYIGLMVGIGGGVPGQEDIRQGDIVVSNKIVQYDMGKTVAGGHFLRTTTVSRPPQPLLTAVARLRADHELEPSQIPFILSRMLERYPMMTNYTYPGKSQDRLFDARYDHADSMGDCDSCDTSRLLSRSSRGNTDPKIHYGGIASANQVMKDSKTRDQLAQELDIICFEMEAAGLIDSFPCLVVRGICDYSDSHKNKQWQEYAAATAAAYAKELLSIIPVTGKEPQANITMIPDKADRQKQLKESLKFDQIYSRRSGIKANHAETCKWLLNHPDYLDWLDLKKAQEHHGFLWIKGKPGAGKSTIMKYLYTQATKNKANTIISFFFNARGEHLERSTSGMYRSLLFQILNAHPRLLDLFHAPEYEDQLDVLYQNILTQSKHPEWDLDLVQDLLRSALSRLDQQRVTIFVDALDECNDQEVEEMVEYFEGIGNSAISVGRPLYICFSSRHYPHIDIDYGRKMTLERQEGHENDIAKYIKSKLKIKRGKLAGEIKNNVLIKADGVFMWVVLVVDILNIEYKDGKIFEVKKRLDTIPTKLSDLFKEILCRDQKNLRDLQLCIQWILFATRPLKLEEYYYAAVSGLSPDELSEWDQEVVLKEDMIRFVLSSSKGLAEITKTKNSTVQFIHESVREFFLKDGLSELWPNLTVAGFRSQSHAQLQECCYAYLKLDISHYVPSNTPLPKASSDEAKELRSTVIEKFPFLEYATRHVLFHANAAGKEYPQDSFLRQFPLSLWIELNNLFEKHEIRRYTSAASLLYIIADNGFALLIETALRLDPTLDILGERYRYPFFAALANGHLTCIRALLQQETGHSQDAFSSLLDYSKNFRPHKGETPLSWAITHNYEPLVLALLEKKADGGRLYDDGEKILLWAASKGNERITQLLLENEVKVDTRDPWSRTPLSWASRTGNKRIVRALLEKGAEIDTKDGTGRTPLSFSAQLGHENIIQLLLENGANTNSEDFGGRTSLSWAAEAGNAHIVHLFKNMGVSTQMTDKNGRTPLSWTAQNGHRSVVQLLLEEEVGADVKDNNGRTPLSWAAAMGQCDVVQLLLEKGADPNVEDKDGWTPSFWATWNGETSTIHLLVERGIDFNVKDTVGRTLLSYASLDATGAVVHLLLENGVDMEIKDSSGRTPLHYAVLWEVEASTHLLLEAGADADTRDEDGRTPLSWAAQMNNEAILRLLLHRGAFTDARDKLLRTPLLWAIAHVRYDNPTKNQGHRNYQMQLMLLEQQRKQAMSARQPNKRTVMPLFQNGADSNADDISGQTPLLGVVDEEHKSTTSTHVLQSYQMQLMRLEQQKRQAMSARQPNKRTVMSLEENGADPNREDIGGQTPLSGAIDKEHKSTTSIHVIQSYQMQLMLLEQQRKRQATLNYEHIQKIVKLLLENGADPNAEDIDGQTPLLLAVLKDHIPIIRLLRPSSPS